MNQNLHALLYNPDTIKTTVCITFCGRSGSYLLSNLLDGHDNILSTPPHSAIGLFEAIAACSRHAGKVEPIVQHLVESLPYLFDDADHASQLHGATHGGGVPRAQFTAYLREGLACAGSRGAVNFKTLFRLVFIVYAICKGRDIKTTSPVIAWQKHIPVESPSRDIINRMLEDEVIFLTCIRRPAVSLGAHFLHHTKEAPIEPLHKLFSHITGMFIHSALRGKFTLKEYAIRFEDLHRHTEQVMRTIARLIGVEFDPILCRTTLEGEDFYFGKSGKLITGTDPARAESKKTPMLNGLDKFRLRMVLSSAHSAWGYGELGAIGRLVKRNRRLYKFLMYLPWWAEIITVLHEFREIIADTIEKGKTLREGMMDMTTTDERWFIPLLPITDQSKEAEETVEAAESNPQPDMAEESL